MFEWNTERSALRTRRFVAFYIGVVLTTAFGSIAIWNSEAATQSPFIVTGILLGACVFCIAAYVNLTTDELYDLWRATGIVTVLLLILTVLLVPTVNEPSVEVLHSHPAFGAILVLFTTSLFVTFTTMVSLGIGMFDRWRADPPEELQP